ncbi:MAG TPA: regulatory protein RecX [Nevskiaceae bacterium]|nr:regulatory protein RecX [Nevskiaceae bacterium]
MRRSKDLSAAGARNAALRTLGRREHSAAELSAKLAWRGYDEETVRDTVSSLAGKGWQSDERYAEQLVRSRIAQGYGPLRIEAELAAAGVDKKQVAAAMDSADCDWRASVRALHQRRFKSAPQGAAEWQKQYRFLAGRGYTSSQIHAVLREAPESD